jgi:DNA-binding response OmpR family regulator
MLRMVSHALGAQYTVHTARDATEARRMLTTIRKPDAMILDVMMPDMDGFSLAKVLRQDPAFQSVPILFLTAKNESGAVVNAIVSGARYYMTKPFQTADLIAKVQRMIEECPTIFVGSVPIDVTQLEASARRIAQILEPLSAAPGAAVEVTIEIRAKVPSGVPKPLVQQVAEQAKGLSFRTASFSNDDGEFFLESQGPVSRVSTRR